MLALERAASPLMRRMGSLLYRARSPVLATLPVAVYLSLAYYAVHEIVPRHLGASANVYVAQPLIWGGLATLAFALWRRLPDRPGTGAAHIALAVAAALVQLSLLATAGVAYGFGHSPYSHEIPHLAGNGLYIVTLLFGFEMSRAYLLHVWCRANVSVAFIVVTLSFAALTLAPGQYTVLGDTEQAFQFTGGQLLPAIAQSALATFLASFGGPAPALAYRLALAVYLWFSPVLADLDWMVTAFVGTVGPVLALVIISDMSRAEATPEKVVAEPDEGGLPVALILGAIMVVAALWLNSGLFGVTPSLVSGHSMSPAFDTGDIVLVRETDPADLVVGDVIRYRMGNISIMHRIIEIGQGADGPVFITKGDSNNQPDDPVVAGQVEGKVVFVIPMAGWLPIKAGKLLDGLR